MRASRRWVCFSSEIRPFWSCPAQRDCASGSARFRRALDPEVSVASTTRDAHTRSADAPRQTSDGLSGWPFARPPGGLKQQSSGGFPMLKLDNKALLRDAAYIDGEWRGARSGARFAVRNPATGEVIAEIADLSEEDVREAIEAAHRAWGSWRA